MFNVKALTDTLSSMDLAGLQKYAALHKDDPYVMAMALSIANTKKKAKVAREGMAGQRPMPKVVDQEIANMTAVDPMGNVTGLPENQGIGTLPAPNMAAIGKAGGGIVAFDEGGEVEHYQVGGSTRYPYGMVGQDPNSMFAIPGLVSANGFPTANNPDLAARIAQIEALPSTRFSRSTKDSMIAEAKSQAGIAATQSPLTAPTQLPPQGSPKVPDNTVVPAAVQQTRDQAPPAAPTQTPPPDKGQTGINPNMPSGQGIGFGIAPLQSAGKWLESQLPAKEKAQTEEEYTKKREAIYGPLNEKVQGMIDTERAKLKDDRAENAFMAMIEGGLAAAAGTSQYGLQNIAAGFGQGAKSYGQGLKELRLAAKEISKLDMDQQKAIAAQKIGDLDAYEKYTNNIAERNSKIEQHRTAGLASMAAHTISGQYSLAGHQVSANAYKESAQAYRDQYLEQRDIAQVEGMRKNIYDEVIKDPRYKVNSAAANAEVTRRLQEQLKNFPRLAQYATLPTTGGASGASTAPSFRYNIKTGQLEPVGQ